MPTKVLLIDPPFSRFMNYHRYFYPIGLTYVAGALKNAGYKVKIYDAEHSPTLTSVKFGNITSNYNLYMKALENKNHEVWKEVRDIITTCKPDVVGISSIAPCKIGSTFKVAEISKEYDKDVEVIVGGQLSAEGIEEVLNNSNIDIVVRGEGEITTVELLNKLESGKIENVTGISVKKNGKLIHTHNRPFIENLDSIAFPYIESLIGLESYRPIDLGMMMTSRGCPYSCSFCGLKDFWGHKTRWRTPENVIEEVIRLKETFNVPYLFFRDACFTLNRKWLFELCRKLLETVPEMKWECTTRIDLIDDEIIKHIKKAGCQKIRIGIESGSDKILKSYNKGVTTADIRKQAKILKENRIPWLAYFMFGSPEETEEDIYATMDLIKEIKPTFVTVGTFYPVPGSEIYNELKKRGELPKDLDYNTLSTRTLNTHYMRHLSLEQYKKLMKEIVLFTEKINQKHYSNDPLFSTKLEPKEAT